MKIAFISIMAGSPWGGSEYLWVEAAMEALRNNHEVIVSVFDWSARHPLIQELERAGAQIHIRRRWAKFAFADRIINRLRFELYSRGLLHDPYAKIRNFRPDVICVSQGGSTDLVYDGVQCLIADRNTPVVIISQMNFEHRILPFHIIEPLQKLFRIAKVAYFVSQRNLEVLERQICLPLPHGEVIANPVNLKTTGVLPFPSLQNTPVRMACVGRLESDAKGQDILIQVLSAEVWKDRDWILSLYGSGRDEQYLRMLVKAFGLEDRVIFRGHVHDIRELWASHHILLMPSLREGTPLALIEAMACGRPSVVTDVAGNAVYCRENETGFLAESPNVKYFGAAMERAWASMDRWEAMGKAGFDFYDNHTDKNPALTLLQKVESLKK